MGRPCNFTATQIFKEPSAQNVNWKSSTQTVLSKILPRKRKQEHRCCHKLHKPSTTTTMNDQNETTASPSEPKLCKMGCGFFVSNTVLDLSVVILKFRPSFDDVLFFSDGWHDRQMDSTVDGVGGATLLWVAPLTLTIESLVMPPSYGGMC